MLRRRRAARPSRATFVREALPAGGVGAEIGVHLGEFTAELLELAKPTHLHLFDLWYELGPEWHWGDGERSTTAALVAIIKRYDAERPRGRLRRHLGDDLVQLETLPDGHFDWVYLDSSHLYDHTKAELALLTRKVRPDGVIAGDDWLPDPEHPHHGVFRAVTELVDDGGWSLVYASEADLQWAIARTG